MKKIIIALLVVIILLSFASCIDEETEQSYSIKDALKISAYVFDETIDGNVYYDFNTVYDLEQLKMNELRSMAPNTNDVRYLEMFLEFDGIIEVIAENEDIQLSINNTLTRWHSDESIYSERIDTFTTKFSRKGFVSLSPLFGELIGRVGGIYGWTGEVGAERYLNINAYKFDNEKTPVIRARVKLVALEDSEYTPDPIKGFGYSIEVVSYEYSDMAKLLDDIVDDEIE
jgi:hypothetical protein